MIRTTQKITLRATAGLNHETREFFYQDTDSSHAYVSGKNTHLRKTLDQYVATTITSFDHELDAAGRRLSMTDKDGTYTQFALDPLRQHVAGSRTLRYGVFRCLCNCQDTLSNGM